MLNRPNFFFIIYSIFIFFHLCRTLGDSKEEAKASGNLANTLKFLGNFDEAFSCCQRQLDISRELDDKVAYKLSNACSNHSAKILIHYVN